MEITYHLSKDDYLRYNMFLIRRIPALKRQVILRFLVVPGIILVESLSSHLQWVVTVVVAVIFSLLWGAYLVWIQRQAVAAQTAARRDSIGLHTLSLQPECLREQTTVLETRVEWQKVLEIVESPQMIVLFLGPRWAFFVPKSAFPTPEQAQAFLDTARACHRGALAGTMPALPQQASVWPPAPQRIL